MDNVTREILRALIRTHPDKMKLHAALRLSMRLFRENGEDAIEAGIGEFASDLSQLIVDEWQQFVDSE